ncbi:DUF4097 and DUF4098 domain-containing protein YvlB [Nocardioides ginsengisegetis]|uniref:DUF4097 and DUF4098 domain-containing protein YvlB n=1 Tax=Nocardioides ginsengisegetis TaxID=661491 RepID=A0A7W3J403_9ACTN|nr:DUF4097 family beta strand repeat-containing protein [Nocardioides ginsengisegetis]MBA8805906.1 DUF4097 and DUF4098 domain-containing protein YvlB [Nocardioides ginsengisegetis]
MPEHHFETLRPTALYVEVGKGTVTITATDTTETLVSVTGRDADSVEVRQDGDEISVVAPHQRTGFLSGDARIDVRVTLPTDSDLAVKTGSADITVEGRVGTARVKSGSGEVQLDTLGGPATVETGSGDVRVSEALGELRAKSGSGEISVGHATSAVSVSTGSGDVEIGTANGPAVVKTGSGDLKIVDAQDDVTLTSGSGDLLVGTAHRGRFTAKGASSDVHVGIPAGVPVWTDISTISGSIRSNLRGAGEPAEGADHVEVRAKTVSGDIVLTEV